MERQLAISLGPERVSGLLLRPDDAKALFVFAHGAGVGMNHPSMASAAEGLAARGIATLRFNFPFMEKRTGRPDSPRIAHVAVRAAVGAAGEMAGDLPLFAGGRSFGGRMTSQAQALEPLRGVRGLVFLGFPLHPAGNPGIERADHLGHVQIPMLFVSGSRDALAEIERLKSVVEDLRDRATLHVVDQADHGLRVPAKSGRTSEEAQGEAFDAVAEWMAALATS
jgi:predicted alpha/beta-hydrolase family hydrolase